jgi:hypothetical protein
MGKPWIFDMPVEVSMRCPSCRFEMRIESGLHGVYGGGKAKWRCDACGCEAPVIVEMPVAVLERKL